LKKDIESKQFLIEKKQEEIEEMNQMNRRNLQQIDFYTHKETEVKF